MLINYFLFLQRDKMMIIIIIMEKGAHEIRPLSETNSNLQHQHEHHNSICSENTLQISFEDLREFSFLHFFAAWIK